MKGSFASRDRHCGDSAHTNAGARWNAFVTASGTGAEPGNKRALADSR
jgi:hypothetical protein